MTEDAKTIAELRVLVGYLGEQQPAWWPSQFYSSQADAFLRPVFARTTALAQYHGVTAAAARKHDEFIGVGRIFHLFRLPEVFEQSAAAVFADPAYAEHLRAAIGNREDALARLGALAGSRRSATEGPIVVGDLGSGLVGALQTCAGLYFDAFNRGIRTYPYLREAS